jgi:hypothetical protein
MEARTQRTLVIFALVAALGVLSIQVADFITILQAEAGCERGGAGSHAFNQSKGRCFDRALSNTAN